MDLYFKIIFFILGSVMGSSFMLLQQEYLIMNLLLSQGRIVIYVIKN